MKLAVNDVMNAKTQGKVPLYQAHIHTREFCEWQLFLNVGANPTNQWFLIRAHGSDFAQEQATYPGFGPGWGEHGSRQRPPCFLLSFRLRHFSRRKFLQGTWPFYDAPFTSPQGHDGLMLSPKPWETASRRVAGSDFDRETATFPSLEEELREPLEIPLGCPITPECPRWRTFFLALTTSIHPPRSRGAS